MHKPQEDEVQIGFRAPIDMKKQLERTAKERDLTLTQVIREAIREYLARKAA